MTTVATLGELLVDLRGELGASLSAAQATQIEPAHKVKLQRIQRTLWQDFAWPHLRARRDITMAAGQYLYDLPADIPLTRIEKVEVEWSGSWYPIERGIASPEWNAYDPDNDERSDPVLRWDPRENGQFAVWPVPAGADQVVRFTGIAALAPFVEQGDSCTLDRDLIVLSAASELARDDASAQRFAARASRLYAQLKGNAEFGGDRVANINAARGGGFGRWPIPPRVGGN